MVADDTMRTSCVMFPPFKLYTLPGTNIAPENEWLEYDRFLLGLPIFRCYVSFREGISFSHFILKINIHRT